MFKWFVRAIEIEYRERTVREYYMRNLCVSRTDAVGWPSFSENGNREHWFLVYFGICLYKRVKGIMQTNNHRCVEIKMKKKESSGKIRFTQTKQ